MELTVKCFFLAGVLFLGGSLRVILHSGKYGTLSG